MGRGDVRTRKGKIFAGSSGNSRQKPSTGNTATPAEKPEAKKAEEKKKEDK